MDAEYLKRLEYRVTLLTEAARFALCTNRYLWNRLRWDECRRTVEALEAALDATATAQNPTAAAGEPAANAGDA